jgi:signal transduction histidine kinase
VLVHIGTGVPFGMVAMFCVLGVVAALAMPLWWLFPTEAPLQFAGLVVTSWGAAAVAALTQVLAVAAVAYWVVPPLGRTHARICLSALEPSDAERLTERVEELTETRAGVLDAHGAELRRIERDLHDSTQARLVAIAMRLGVAREALADDPGTVATLLREAHEGAEEAMVELRDVIRTIYPPILADRGLAGALAALCARSGIPARLDLEDLARMPAAVEAAAYFVVAESLTNAAKHSRASHAAVRLRRSADRLSIEVVDDGVGGVDETRGSGVVGIRRRAAALDGSVRLTSPVGGPTSITVELPCGS